MKIKIKNPNEKIEPVLEFDLDIDASGSLALSCNGQHLCYLARSNGTLFTGIESQLRSSLAKVIADSLK